MLAFRLLALEFGQEQLVPVVGAGDVAGTQFRREAVARVDRNRSVERKLKRLAVFFTHSGPPS